VVKRVLIASHRGYCAGVERAVETVERALEIYGPPVYVRKQIVHNTHVVGDLQARGAIFVESEAAVPRGGRLVLAAHGVAPEVYRTAAARGLATIDATCPLVKKVHVEVRRFADAGYCVILIGHAGHEEVVGTAGEAPEAVVLVETLEQAHAVDVPDPERVAYVTQTTLSIDETAEIIAALHERFPALTGPRKEDICYATTNRQHAVKEMLPEIDVLLVVGSGNSSNSTRLVETAQASEVAAYMIEDKSEIDETWLEGRETVGLTSGPRHPRSSSSGCATGSGRMASPRSRRLLLAPKTSRSSFRLSSVARRHMRRPERSPRRRALWAGISRREVRSGMITVRTFGSHQRRGRGHVHTSS
jgi:4-hydroxy-3-methylbut-2-en-1-yl diphosphate reductase